MFFVYSLRLGMNEKEVKHKVYLKAAEIANHHLDYLVLN